MARRSATRPGTVIDRASNAVWGMQFVWPVKADYRIVYVADDYSTTIIGREKRDYAWIMAQAGAPRGGIPPPRRHARRAGYDISKLRKVPQRWN